jgi:hypothetical protein
MQFTTSHIPKTPSVSMSKQRPRRPTVWEVTFPDEVIDVDDDDKGDEGEDLELEEVPDLKSKRTTRRNVGDRVRCVSSSLVLCS